MSYPEGLRNYKGPWPPPKDFLLTAEDAAMIAKVIPPWAARVGKVLGVAVLAGLVFPDTNIQRVPVLGVLLHVLGLVFPMIRAVGLYSHESLATVTGVSIIVLGIILAVVPAMLDYFQRIFALERYSLLLRYIHLGQAPRYRLGYIAMWILIYVVGPIFLVAAITSDIDGYISLYIHHIPLHTVVTSTSFGSFGLLSGAGLNTQHGVASSFYFFGTLGDRYEFPVFAVMYGMSLVGMAFLTIIEVVAWTHIRMFMKSTWEDWRVLGRTQQQKRK